MLDILVIAQKHWMVQNHRAAVGPVEAAGVDEQAAAISPIVTRPMAARTPRLPVSRRLES
jgi:hypothetical protein